MFEAVISAVKTGRVQRKTFETREEAEQHLEQTRERLVNPPKRWDDRTQQWQEQKPKSMRDYRMEVVRLENPAVVRVAGRIATRRKKVAA